MPAGNNRGASPRLSRYSQITGLSKSAVPSSSSNAGTFNSRISRPRSSGGNSCGLVVDLPDAPVEPARDRAGHDLAAAGAGGGDRTGAWRRSCRVVIGGNCLRRPQNREPRHVRRAEGEARTSAPAPRVVGTVGLPSPPERRRRFRHRARSAGLPPSTDSAKRALLSVYSWPQQTSVLPGNASSARSDTEHLGRCPLQQPPASEREQGVAAKQHRALREVEGEVAAGVARRVDHPRPAFAQRHRSDGQHKTTSSGGRRRASASLPTTFPPNARLAAPPTPPTWSPW